jgi:trimeric autotransporter adhesin
MVRSSTRNWIVVNPNNPIRTRNRKEQTVKIRRTKMIKLTLRAACCGLPVLIALACLAFSPTASAADGGVPNQNTAEGTGALSSLTTGANNTAAGFNALHSLATGSESTATGSLALFNDTFGTNTAYGFSALYTNTTGAFNTATGRNALFSNETGTNNTATGGAALFSNTVGSQNTATGRYALFTSIFAGDNTATGAFALTSNSEGFYNTATGSLALYYNNFGSNNTATGYLALFRNTTGSYNIATGNNALEENTTGEGNTATGLFALGGNTTGANSTADGVLALLSNTTGDNNTASGAFALQNNTTGSNNIALGNSAGINLTTGSNNIDIGALGLAGESHTIRIGRVGVHKAAYIRGISGVTVASGVAVIIAGNGQLGTVQSSARFKTDIKPMDKASEAILALKPVTFHYKQELDPDGISQFGLLAEEVEKVNPDLVVRDENGKVNTVRYEAVNAMLLNEFLKEHSQVQELKAIATKQQAMNAQQQKQIEALTATVQKVSNQLEVNKAAQQVVASNQ